MLQMQKPMELQSPVQEPAASQNHTGIPDALKQRVEVSSGFSLDSVRVHYHSDQPARFQALAYAKGTEVFLGPGQERHLPHELSHVVQQLQGRVPVTGRVNGEGLNDSPALEQEADRFAVTQRKTASAAPLSSSWVIQRILGMRQQNAANCGMFALAGVLRQLGVPDVTLGEALTAHAVANGLSFMGEAFDAANLAQVGNDYLAANLPGAQIACRVVNFGTATGLQDLFNAAKTAGAYVLCPYYPNDAMRPQQAAQLPPDQMDQAHWSALDTVAMTRRRATPSLYEGNYGSRGRVTAQEMFDSNQSLGDAFDWTAFRTRDPVLYNTLYRDGRAQLGALPAPPPAPIAPLPEPLPAGGRFRQVGGSIHETVHLREKAVVVGPAAAVNGMEPNYNRAP